MPAYKLLMHPANPRCPPAGLDTLTAHLTELGLIGAPIRHPTETLYSVGERLLELVTFLGCSPHIELQPPDSRDELEAMIASGRLCHVRLSETKWLQFRTDCNPPEPRCPSCRKPVRNWQQLLEDWQSDPDQLQWQCRVCRHSGQLTELNFRKSAVFARTFLEIWGIYPSEAIPGEELLASLRTLTGCEWKTLYINE